jgi:hypothetical protein
MYVDLIVEEHVPLEIFDDFRAAVEVDGFQLQIDRRPKDGPFASLVWLMPTAIMLYITKSYFDGFLGEMGKDHYTCLKGGLKTLRDRLSLVKVTLFTSGANKAPTAQPYSLAFSIWIEGDQGKVKFLIPQECEQSEADAAMDAFLDFLEAYYAGALQPAQLTKLANAPVLGRTLLLAFNPETGMIEPYHPVAGFDAP